MDSLGTSPSIDMKRERFSCIGGPKDNTGLCFHIGLGLSLIIGGNIPCLDHTAPPKKRKEKKRLSLLNLTNIRMSLLQHRKCHVVAHGLHIQWSQNNGNNIKFRLNAPARIGEIVKTITSMKPNKIPVPDGITVEFYNKFKEQLSRRLQILFELCL